MEGVSETRLFALLGREGLDGLECKVVVEVEVVEVLAMDQEVEHVVALSTHLQAGLDPVELRRLKVLGGLERAEEVLFRERLGRAVVEVVEHVALEQLLVRHAHFDRVARRTVLVVPRVDERHVLRTARTARAQVEGSRRPVQRNGTRRVLSVERRVAQQWLDLLGQNERLTRIGIEFEALVVLVVVAAVMLAMVVVIISITVKGRDGVDDGIKVEGRQVGVLGLDVRRGRVVVDREMHRARTVVVEVREGDTVLGTQRLADDDLVNVVELVPVLVLVEVAVERLELGSAGDGDVERLGGVERLEVKEIKVVRVREVAQQLRAEAVEVRHDRHRQAPLAVARSVDEARVLQRLVVVQPLGHRRILVRIELHLDGVGRLDVEDVVAVVDDVLLVVERREAHALKVAARTLLATHHDPHGAPLRHVHGLDHERYLVDERDGARDVEQHRDVAHLLPRHRHVLEQLEHRVRHVLERAEIDALVMTELARAHVAVVLDDLANMLRRHVLLLRLDITELALVAVALGIELLPTTSLLFEFERMTLVVIQQHLIHRDIQQREKSQRDTKMELPTKLTKLTLSRYAMLCLGQDQASKQTL